MTRYVAEDGAPQADKNLSDWDESSSTIVPQPNPMLEASYRAVTDLVCDDCTPRIWVSSEYLLWWTSDAGLPSLVASSESGTPQDSAALLGASTTTTLFGEEQLNGDLRSGARFVLGGWLDLCNWCGVELNFLVLGNDETRFEAGSEFEILGRPFFNALNSEQDAKLLNFPGVVQSVLGVEAKTTFYTGEALLRKRISGWGPSAIDWYLGYRTARIVDDIRITEDGTILSGPAAGSRLLLSDQFRTRNTFHGVDVGVRCGARLRPRLALEVSGKVALGSTRTEADNIGFSTVTSGGTTTTTDTGFLVQPTNRGTSTNNNFSAMTEVGVVGRRTLRPGFNLTIGYTFFFWQDVTRAGEQIDTVINTSQFPPGVLTGEARPRIRDVQTNFSAHGFRIGFEYLF